MEVLEGIIFYFACGLDPYLLNREPREFQYLRTLVDGAHWQGQKRLRRPDRNGSGGHLGCSGKASKFVKFSARLFMVTRVKFGQSPFDL